MSRMLFVASGVFTVAALFATPEIPEDSLKISQGGDRKILVKYTLGGTENAIVTVDFETNVTGTVEGPWVSIGARNFRSVDGDVNKELVPGDHTIIWRPTQDWPDHEIAGENFRARVKAWAKTCPPDYLAIDLTAGGQRFFYPCEDALPFGIGSDLYRTDFLVMRKIPAAGVQWRMGSPTTEKGRWTDGTETAHYVTLSKDYYMAVFPVTHVQLAHIRGESPSSISAELRCQAAGGYSWNWWRYGSHTGTAPSGSVYPVDTNLVATSAMARLRQLTGLSTLDFPTSAQWEFACRAGTSTALYTGVDLTVADAINDKEGVDEGLAPIAWYRQETKREFASSTYANGRLPFRVGAKQSNAWGLYDMLGLCYDLCLDWARTSYSAEETDPIGPDSGSRRVTRGGAWNCWPRYCRAAYCGSQPPTAAYTAVGDGELFAARPTCDAVIP